MRGFRICSWLEAWEKRGLGVAIGHSPVVENLCFNITSITRRLKQSCEIIKKLGSVCGPTHDSCGAL